MSFRTSFAIGSAAPASRLRAHRVLNARGLALPDVAARSFANDVWVLPREVLRIVRSPDMSPAMEREERLLKLLPHGAPVPEVRDAGQVDGYAWLLLARLPGTPLNQSWPTMTDPQRSDALTGYLRTLMAVQRSVPVGRVRSILTDSAEYYRGFDPDLFRRDIAAIAAQGRISDRLGERLIGMHQELAMSSAVKEGPREVLCQGDAHTGNALWNGDRISGIVDFGEAMLGPADLDLDKLIWRIHMFDVTHGTGLASVIDAFEHDDIQRLLPPGWPDRLRFYALTSQAWLGAIPEVKDTLGKECPRLLAELATSTSYIDQLEGLIGHNNGLRRP